VARPCARRRKDQGVALVELAVVLPLLALVLVVVVDLGLVLREYQILQNATREAARFSVHMTSQVGALPGATFENVQAQVVQYMAQEGITISAADVTVSQFHNVVAADGLTLRCSRIDVTYTRALLIGGGVILPAGEITLSASSIFQNHYGF
jgi:Flp pilus assembly protein TadG